MSQKYNYQLVSTEFLESARPERLEELQTLTTKAEVSLPTSQIDALEKAWVTVAADMFSSRRLDQIRKLIPFVLKGDAVVDRRVKHESSSDPLRVLGAPRLAQAMEFVKSIRPSKLDRQTKAVQEATESLRELASKCDPVTHRWVVYVEK